MSEHTKEPWTTNGVRIESTNEHGWANDGWIVGDCDGPDALANARRIVACVNACKGIDTKFLEEALLAGAEPALYAHTLMQQRDELLAALKPIAVSGEISAKIIADARAAITKVEAGQ